MKKLKTLLVLVLAASTLLLSGCGAKRVPDGMDEEALGELGRQIVTHLVNDDYQAVVDAFDPDTREQYHIDVDAVTSVMTPISKAGAFVQFYRVLVVGGASDNYDGDYAVVAVQCEHEEDDVIFEMSVNTDMALIGLTADIK